jgi:uncharacterized membrane protein YqjE
MANAGGGLWLSLRRLIDTLLEVGQVRLTLLTVEFEREKLRIFDALLWAGISLLLLGIGLVLAAAALVMALPPRWQLPALAVLALGCLAGAAWLALQARRRLSGPGGPLPATMAELAADRAAVRPPAP